MNSRRNRTVDTMKKLIIVLLASMALFSPVLRGVAAGQTGVTRIAYDQCQAGSYSIFCQIRIVVDGHDTLIANGVGPRWSPDGSRIVFSGGTDPNAPYFWGEDIAEILVLNIADG